MSPVRAVVPVCTAMTSSPRARAEGAVTGGGEAAVNWKAQVAGVVPDVVRNHPRKSGVARLTPTWSRPWLAAVVPWVGPALPLDSQPTYGGRARDVLPWMGWLGALGWEKVTFW